MKVYLVNVHYDNGEYYEDQYDFDRVEKIFSTKEKALAYINSLKPEDMDEDGEEVWVEGNPYPSAKPENVIRSFYHEKDPEYYDDTCETYDYSITEREVEE